MGRECVVCHKYLPRGRRLSTTCGYKCRAKRKAALQESLKKRALPLMAKVNTVKKVMGWIFGEV